MDEYYNPMRVREISIACHNNPHGIYYCEVRPVDFEYVSELFADYDIVCFGIYVKENNISYYLLYLSSNIFFSKN